VAKHRAPGSSIRLRLWLRLRTDRVEIDSWPSLICAVLEIFHETVGPRRMPLHAELEWAYQL
jgi:hypothetical protein